MNLQVYRNSQLKTTHGYESNKKSDLTNPVKNIPYKTRLSSILILPMPPHLALPLLSSQPSSTISPPLYNQTRNLQPESTRPGVPPQLVVKSHRISPGASAQPTDLERCVYFHNCNKNKIILPIYSHSPEAHKQMRIGMYKNQSTTISQNFLRISILSPAYRVDHVQNKFFIDTFFVSLEYMIAFLG